MKESILKEFNTEAFQKGLVTWFNENQRELPWRENKDPYRVWVSEIMLQQTRVDTVIPYYTNFMREFPTLEDLAYADEEQILKAWEGLGYYSRVRNLQSAVREVVENYQGQVPETRGEISQLKGVGPYTAGAILSIAFDKVEPAVDGNVMRVLSRALDIEEDIAKPKTRKIFEEALYELIPQADPSSFNQGLMELGALVCTPTSPGCLLCPVREHCRAYERGKQSQLPVKTRKKSQKIKKMNVLMVWNDRSELIIEKRPEKGLLAGLWQFPYLETSTLENEVDLVRKEVECFLETELSSFEGPIDVIEHVFSHLKWEIHVYQAKLSKQMKLSQNQIWVSKKDIERYAFPVSFQKIISNHLMKG
ncbi:adenine glycosylase [Bacillus sp. TS-2]|nr:adenine glycosylase [Bacillus sp. TS-2]